MMEKRFTYRNGCLFLGAAWFAGFGLVFSGYAAFQTLSGRPMPMNGKIPPVHSLSAWVPALMPLIAVLLGAWIYLFAANSSVVLNDDGVTVYNWAKRVIFEAAWSEITSVHRRYDVRGNYNLQIDAAGKTTVVTSSIIGLADLEEELVKKLGPLDSPTSQTGLRLDSLGPR